MKRSTSRPPSPDSASLTLEIARLRSSAISLSADRDSLRAECEQLKPKLVAATSDLRAAQAELAPVQARIATLTAELNSDLGALARVNSHAGLLQSLCVAKGVDQAAPVPVVEIDDVYDSWLAASGTEKQRIFRDHSAEIMGAHIRRRDSAL